MEVINNIDIVMHTTNKKMENKREKRTAIIKKTQENTQEQAQDIKLLSSNPDFYKTFTFNNTHISVYKDVKKPQRILFTINNK